MTEREKFDLIMKYSDRILDLCYHWEEETTSDLQGASEAIIMCVIHDIEKARKEAK